MVDQHPEPAPGQIPAPQVPQVDPTEGEVGLDSLTVLVEERGEARYFPGSWPVAIFQAVKNSSTCSMSGSTTAQIFA